jgi:hypothetical protein
MTALRAPHWFNFQKHLLSQIEKPVGEGKRWRAFSIGANLDEAAGKRRIWAIRGGATSRRF